MSPEQMVPMVEDTSHVLASGSLSIQAVVDLVVVIMGFIAVYYLLRLNNRLGGKLSSAINFFNLGIFINITAILSSTFWVHLYTINGITIDLHHFLMSIGMIFFILSTRKLSGLVVN